MIMENPSVVITHATSSVPPELAHLAEHPFVFNPDFPASGDETDQNISMESDPPVEPGEWVIEAPHPSPTPSQFGSDISLPAYTESMSASLDNLQEILRQRIRELEAAHASQRKADITIRILQTRTEVYRRFVRLLEASRKETEEVRRSISDPSQQEEEMRQRIEELEKQKESLLETVAKTSRRLTWAAKEALKGRRGNAIFVFPELRKGILSLRFEVLAVQAYINNGYGQDDMAGTVTRAVRLIDDTVKLLDEVERASHGIVGNLDENTTVERELRRAASGQARTIESLKNIIRKLRPKAFDPAVRRPFSVNTSPVWSILGQPRSSSSTSTQSGMSMADVANWRDTVGNPQARVFE
ncbi:hypothetical protein V5O48_016128 [Marasmius crinis-equi]|uniref:Uncharacterized protein n=1 Tax=Marasmius crinis-equi TaxID=585013 RepID=A0ABR3ESN7_9AGAR